MCAACFCMAQAGDELQKLPTLTLEERAPAEAGAQQQDAGSPNSAVWEGCTGTGSVLGFVIGFVVVFVLGLRLVRVFVFVSVTHSSGERAAGSAGESNARGVRALLTCAADIFFPLTLFPAPHQHFFPPVTEVAEFFVHYWGAAEVGGAQWKEWVGEEVERRPPLLYAHPLGHHVLATMKTQNSC